jgi:hypothetical protein
MHFEAHMRRARGVQQVSAHAHRILLAHLADERASCARSLVLCERK